MLGVCRFYWLFFHPLHFFWELIFQFTISLITSYQQKDNEGRQNTIGKLHPVEIRTYSRKCVFDIETKIWVFRGTNGRWCYHLTDPKIRPFLPCSFFAASMSPCHLLTRISFFFSCSKGEKYTLYTFLVWRLVCINGHLAQLDHGASAHEEAEPAVVKKKSGAITRHAVEFHSCATRTWCTRHGRWCGGRDSAEWNTTLSSGWRRRAGYAVSHAAQL